MDNDRSVPFLAAVFASALAPVAEEVQRAVGGELVASLGGGVPEDLPCPECGAVCARWLNRRLYPPGRALGQPLGTDHTDTVAMPCPRCGRVWHSCGRGVYYRLRNGLPPLA